MKNNFVNYMPIKLGEKYVPPEESPQTTYGVPFSHRLTLNLIKYLDLNANL